MGTKAYINKHNKKGQITDVHAFTFSDQREVIDNIERYLRTLNLKDHVEDGGSLTLTGQNSKLPTSAEDDLFDTAAIRQKLFDKGFDLTDFKILHYLYKRHTIKETANLVFLSLDTINERLLPIYTCFLPHCKNPQEKKKYRKVIQLLINGDKP